MLMARAAQLAAARATVGRLRRPLEEAGFRGVDRGAARPVLVEGLIDEGSRAADHEECRVYRVDAARPAAPPADARGVPAGDPQDIPVRAGLTQVTTGQFRRSRRGDGSLA
jgi:hypothetical protein